MDAHSIIQQNSRPLEPIATQRAPRLFPLEGIRAVLFDIYGTLFVSASGDITDESGDRRIEAVRQTVASLGLSLRCSEDQIVERLLETIASDHEALRAEGVEFPEVDIIDVWRRVLSSLSDDGLLDRFPNNRETVARFALEYEVRSNPVWPMPHAGSTLAWLNQQGLALGVISNAQEFTRELFGALMGRELEDFGCEPQLQFYSYVHRQAKPGTFLYEQAAKALQAREIAPAATLYVGNDMLKDILPARLCGFRTALFAGDARSLRERTGDPRVADVTPDLILTDLAQLLECLPAP